MFAAQIREAVEAAPGVKLPELTALLWRAFGAGQVSEAEAEELSGLIELRMAVEAAQTSGSAGSAVTRNTRPRKPQRPPVRSVAIERRRRLAASGPLPPALAARFTTGEAAVLRIVGDECRDKGRCVLPLDAIAARAGVGRTTAQNALRLARRLGMVEIEERRLTGAKSLPNRVTIVDREWRQWLTRGPKGIGFKILSTTEIDGFRKGGRQPQANLACHQAADLRGSSRRSRGAKLCGRHRCACGMSNAAEDSSVKSAAIAASGKTRRQRLAQPKPSSTSPTC